MDDESSRLRTFNTPSGRYRWKRMLFGISSAPEIWQRKMYETNAPVLRYYDMAKRVTIQADASQTGLGAALMQDGKPISYASRDMTDTEQNYAQIEKELLATVSACERFNDFIYGRGAVQVETDHKPLESIFKKEIHMASKHLQRMRLRLQKYPLDVRYENGSEMYVADMWSRAYNTETKRDIDNAVSKVDDSEERMFSDMMLPEQKLIELQHATSNGAVLQELDKVTKTGGQP